MRAPAILGLAITIVVLIFWMIIAFKGLKISKSFLLVLLSFLFLGLLIFAYFFGLSSSSLRTDLDAHYEILDAMQSGGWDYVINGSQYADLFVYNTYAYWISLSGNYALLQTIPLLIDFIVFLYIYFDIIKRHRQGKNIVDAREALFVFFLWITVFGIKLAIMGIRCVLAVALCVLAVYNEYVRSKHRMFSLLLYVAALFIHNFAMMVILLRLFSLIKKKWILLTAFIFMILIGRPIFLFLNESIDVPYFNFIFKRVLGTLPSFSFAQIGETSGNAIQLVYIGFIIIVLYLTYISRYAIKNYQTMGLIEGGEKKHFIRLCNFCYTIGLIGLPMATNYLFLERYMYLVAWGLLMIGFYYIRVAIKKKNSNYAWLSLVMSFVLLFVVFFNDIYLFMVYYTESYFLAF